MSRERRQMFSFTMKTISLILVIVVLSSLFVPSAFAEVDGDWEYVVNEDGSVTLTGYTGNKKNVVIPATIGGKQVTVLGDGLFKNNKMIMNVSIPEGVKMIGASVFEGCAKLRHVSLPSTLEVIGDFAFKGCKHLQTLFLPDSLVEIGEGVFIGCDSLEVFANKGTYAAQYLIDHKDQIPRFTLYNITPVYVYEEGSGAAPVDYGHIREYLFGRDLNGHREYKLIIGDKVGIVSLYQFNGSEYVEIGNRDRDRTYVYVDERPYKTIILGKEYILSTEHTIYIKKNDNSNVRFIFNFSPDGELITFDINKNTNNHVRQDNRSVTGSNSSSERFLYEGTRLGASKSDYNSWGLNTSSSLDRNYTKDSDASYDGDGRVKSISHNEHYSEYDHSTDTVYARLSFNSNEYAYFNNAGQADSYNVGRRVSYSSPDDGLLNTPYDEKSFRWSFSRNYAVDNNGLNHKKSETETKSAVYTTYDADGNGVRVSYSDTEVTDYNRRTVTEGTSKRVDNIVPVSQNGSTYYNYQDSLYDSKKIERDFKGDFVGGSFEHRSFSDAESVTESASYTTDYTYDGSHENHYTTYRDGTETDVNTRTDYTYHYVDRVNYSEKTVAGNSDGEVDNSSSYYNYRNEPEQRVNTVSEKEISAYSVDHSTKSTDLDTGAVSTSNYKNKTESLKSYEYVGNTGKFVGWDWNWRYNIDDVYDSGKLASYSVTEYKYDSSTGAWTKESVTVNLKSTYNSETGKSELSFVEPDVDFKTVYPVDLFNNFNVSSAKYVFDDSIITDSNNWRQTDSLGVSGSGSYSRSEYTETEKTSDTTLERKGINQYTDDNYSSEYVSDQVLTYNIDEAEYEYEMPVEVTDPAEIASIKADQEAYKAEIEAIILGETVVTDDSGNLSQADVKGEMLELEQTLKKEETYEITEGNFEKAVAQEVNAEQILDFLNGETTVLDQSPEMKQFVESTEPLAETTVPAIPEAVVNPTPVEPTVEVKPLADSGSSEPVLTAAAPAPVVQAANPAPLAITAAAAPSSEPAPAPVVEAVNPAPVESADGAAPSGESVPNSAPPEETPDPTPVEPPDAA